MPAGSKSAWIGFETRFKAAPSLDAATDRRRHHWMLTPEDVDAVERYFRELATPSAQKGGAAGLEQAKKRSQQKRVG